MITQNLIQQRLSDVQAELTNTLISHFFLEWGQNRVDYPPLAAIHHESHGREEETKPVTLGSQKWFFVVLKGCSCKKPTSSISWLNWSSRSECEIATRKKKKECEIANQEHAVEI